MWTRKETGEWDRVTARDGEHEMLASIDPSSRRREIQGSAGCAECQLALESGESAASVLTTLAHATQSRIVTTGVAYETELRESFDFALREAGAYFMKKGRLHESLHRLAARLDAEEIAYALVGGMALGEHGYVRMTEDVDVLLTPEGLEAFQQRLVGRGYIATHPGAKRTFRDTESGVRIEILVSGEFPGDGKPKPVSFPDPVEAIVDAGNLRVLPLARIVELKLASGMTAPHRLRDLADVQELIKSRGLDDGFAVELDESVRATYLDLYRATLAGGA